jgi:nicotinamide-nucleotide amidase
MYNLSSLEIIKSYLLSKEQTIAVAESVTSGHLQAAFSLAEKASLFFQGGVTTYNLGQKSRFLQVDPIHALSCNCVSEKVATEMARHVCQIFSSQWGIGVTGYAAPDEKNQRDYLFAICTIVFENKVIQTKTIRAIQEEIFENQIYYTNQILQLMGEVVKENMG